MAKPIVELPLISFLCLSIVLFSLALATKESYDFSRDLSTKSPGFKREKFSHLHFYFHDTMSGNNPSAIPVAEAATTNKSASFFGRVIVIDDPLTVKPELSSKQVGRAQGMYTYASQSELSFLLAFTLFFTEGEYNGSTLSLLGRDAIANRIREMPIVGGSGIFRFSRGYALAKTYTVNLTSGDAIVEYDVYVLHY